MESETANAIFVVPELPSATVTFETETVGGVVAGALSSLVMVPVAVAVPRVTLTGLASVTVNVSVGSTAVSPMTAMLTFWVVTPGANVSVPDDAV